MKKGSTAWYKAKSRELSRIRHELKMQFDKEYRNTYFSIIALFAAARDSGYSIEDLKKFKFNW